MVTSSLVSAESKLKVNERASKLLSLVVVSVLSVAGLLTLFIMSARAYMSSADCCYFLVFRHGYDHVYQVRSLMRRKSYLIRNGSSKRGFFLSLLLTLVVIGTLFGVYQVRDDGKSVSENISNESVEVGIPSNTNTGSPLILDRNEEFSGVQIVLDGWSYEILNGRRLGVKLDDGRVGSLSFKPATIADVEGILGKSPEVIRQAFSRLIDGDQRLVCSTSGCEVEGRKLSLSDLVDPRESDWLGSMYEGWGIENGLHIAEINIPKSTQFFNVTGDNMQSVDLVNLSGEFGDIYSGYGKGIYYLGISWGVLHPIDVRWLQSEEGAGDARKNVRRSLSGSTLGSAYQGEGLLAGPADFNGRDTALSLNSSQITYYSSPVTGCGTFIICTPRIVEFDLKEIKSVEGGVCDSYGKGTLSIKSYEVVMNLPHLTHIGGGWRGESNVFDGDFNLSSVLGFFGKAPLVKGDVKVYSLSTELSDSVGLVSIAGGRSLSSLGWFGLERVTDLFGGELKAC